jgi:hypothetical protein
MRYCFPLDVAVLTDPPELRVLLLSLPRATCNPGAIDLIVNLSVLRL